MDAVRRDLQSSASSGKKITDSQKQGAPNSWQRLIYSCRDKTRQLLGLLLTNVLFGARAKLTDERRRRQQQQQRPATMDRRQVTATNGAADAAARQQWAPLRRRQLHTLRMLLADAKYKQILQTLFATNIDYQYAINLGVCVRAFE
jgi:hypothetical protein